MYDVQYIYHLYTPFTSPLRFGVDVSEECDHSGEPPLHVTRESKAPAAWTVEGSGNIRRCMIVSIII